MVKHTCNYDTPVLSSYFHGQVNAEVESVVILNKCCLELHSILNSKKSDIILKIVEGVPEKKNLKWLPINCYILLPNWLVFPGDTHL